MSGSQHKSSSDAELDAVIVGAGFAGMYMLHRLRGLGFRVRVFEAGSGVGGTWYWNRYPGARCDIESMEYSFQFSGDLQQEWDWSERYATQPEILRYANYVADRFDLRRDIQFETRIESAVFDEQGRRWSLETSDRTRASARFCIMATGCLSSANTPKLAGLDSFAGHTYHTGRWPHEDVSFTGQRVGIVGTGSSAIQAIPIIAEQAAHLYVFQRTPNYSVPAHNAPLDPEVRRQVKMNYKRLRDEGKQSPNGVWSFRFNSARALQTTAEDRRREFEERWAHGGVSFMGAYADLMFEPEANATAADFVRGKIREIVRDPQVAEALMPRYVIGCKRLCVDTGYFATFNRPNVTLVDISASPIEAITPHAVKALGREYAIDALVLATGFDAMTGALTSIDIRGRGGKSLKEKWRAGPRNYLGLSTEGFPNFFTITGPGSPSVFTNMIPSIEQHVDWVTECLRHMREKGIALIEPVREAEDQWVNHVNEVADAHLRSACNSWYIGANIPGKQRVFMPYIGGFPAYQKKCKEVVAAGYEGFALSG
ncbi:MAG: NAD(P)/FAD-dependent oxidoreductase [Betaproteobacteria bacterium]|nr:NAD(P)/FAD-dependent oxidoreductase [Betaproteobacteria bacterium]